MNDDFDNARTDREMLQRYESQCRACGHPVVTHRGPGWEPVCRWCFAMWAWVAFRPTGPRLATGRALRVARSAR